MSSVLIEDVEFQNTLRLWRIEVGLQSVLTAGAYRDAQSLLGDIEAELPDR